MKPVVLSCFCLVALLATTSFAAPTARKADSSSESVESNESNSKEKTGEDNNAAVVTEDTNTAQEVMVPDNVKLDTVKLEPTKTVDHVEQTAGTEQKSEADLVQESTRSEVKSETTHTVEDTVESTNVEAKDTVKAVVVGDVTVSEELGKKVLEDSKVESVDTTRTLETVERTQEAVQVTDVTQKVSDLPTVEVTVTLAEAKGVDTNEAVPVTTETDAGVADTTEV